MGRMRIRLALVVCALSLAMLALPRAAAAQCSEASGIGVGVEAMITSGAFDVAPGPGFNLRGIGGPAVVYQAPNFHVDGIVHFSSNGATSLGVGGRFFYELHSTQASDLSIGGGLGFLNVEVGDDSETAIHFEVGAKIRAFLAPSVAVNASVGFGFISGDFFEDDPLFLTGQLLGTVGMAYFFF